MAHGSHRVFLRVQSVGGSQINALKLKLMRPRFAVCAAQQMHPTLLGVSTTVALKRSQIKYALSQDPNNINDAK